MGVGRLDEALQKAVTEAKAPGAVAFVGDRISTIFHGAAGSRMLVPEKRPAEKDTIYDLASLTKVIATTSAVMLLHEEGAIDLDAPVSNYLPIPAFGAFTVRHCLTHTAGLNPGRPYYKECTTHNEMFLRYAEEPLSWTPGTRRRYSDVGFMILGKIVEMAARDSLDAFCKRRIFTPLNMARTAFNPPKEWRDRCAATEKCAWRGRVMCGEVHDENAYAVGGVSGHAGLFSTAEDLAIFCRAFMDGKILKPETIKAMTPLGLLPFYPWQTMGWKVDPWAGGSEGYLPCRTAIGHTGWTGTSIWMDPVSGCFVILLSNTCHPSRSARDTESLRRTFHDAVARQLFPGRATPHTGLDRLVRDGFDAIENKRIALLANRASVSELERPILDVLKFTTNHTLRYVYSPEHGFEGMAEAGEKVASEDMFISLYGDRKAPREEELREIDLFVIDLQDVGARYYTYAATMHACLRACAAAAKPVLILDRPNPLGGTVLEGPVADQAERDVCWAKVPIRHGMTLGETAKFFKETDPALKNLKLSVNEIDGWPRERLFGECALPWIPPSPNIPDPPTAVLYAGMCLFEGTNLNEGRGTDTPFQLVGAPWLDAEAVVAGVPEACAAGCRLSAVRYTPRAIPHKATDPRFRDKECQGVRIELTDAATARPVTLAVALLRAIREKHREHFEWQKTFDVLAGGPLLREGIESGQDAMKLAQAWSPSIEVFDKKRPRLYE